MFDRLIENCRAGAGGNLKRHDLAGVVHREPDCGTALIAALSGSVRIGLVRVQQAPRALCRPGLIGVGVGSAAGGDTGAAEAAAGDGAAARAAEFWSRAVIVPAVSVVRVGGWVAVESAQGELVPLVEVDVLLYRIT
jgi:hypothetical protein